MTGVLIKRGNLETDTHRRKTMQTDIGPSPNQREGPGTDSPQEPSEGAGTCQHLDYGVLASRTETINFYCLNHVASDTL